MIDDLTVIILAGVKSSRMGEDKGLMPLYDKPMVEYVIDTARKISDHIIIISENANYKKFGFPVFKDLEKNKGPLGGIYTGLKKSDKHQNLVLSCDVPYVTEELLRFLYLHSSKADITIARHNDWTHQTIALYTKDCIPVFEKQIKAGELKIQDAFSKLRVHFVDTDQFPETVFRNIYEFIRDIFRDDG